jgi:prolipoprotein diacylglyceryl transferase
VITDSGIQLVGITFYWYGLIVVAALWFGAAITARLAHAERLPTEYVWRALIPISILSVIGARVWFLLFPPQSAVDNGRTAAWLLTNAFDLNQGAIAVWSGGLGFFGGLLGGGLGLWMVCRSAGQPFVRWVDVCAVSLPFAHALGRIANGVTQEIYGAPTDLPWGMLVNRESQRVGPYTDVTAFPLDVTRFHPVFAYEAALCVVLGLVLAYIHRRTGRRAGDVALVYCLGYGAIRWLVEFGRINVATLGGVNISQVAALLLAVGAAVLLLRQRVWPMQRA